MVSAIRATSAGGNAEAVAPTKDGCQQPCSLPAHSARLRRSGQSAAGVCSCPPGTGSRWDPATDGTGATAATEGWQQPREDGICMRQSLQPCLLPMAAAPCLDAESIGFGDLELSCRGRSSCRSTRGHSGRGRSGGRRGSGGGRRACRGGGRRRGLKGGQGDGGQQLAKGGELEGRDERLRLGEGQEASACSTATRGQAAR